MRYIVFVWNEGDEKSFVGGAGVVAGADNKEDTITVADELCAEQAFDRVQVYDLENHEIVEDNINFRRGSK